MHRSSPQKWSDLIENDRNGKHLLELPGAGQMTVTELHKLHKKLLLLNTDVL